MKGPVDFIASEEGQTTSNTTGNAGMTVGGTGDVLSGYLASLLAKRANPYDACRIGAYIVGKAGDSLYKQKGFCFSASDLALELPYAILQFSS